MQTISSIFPRDPIAGKQEALTRLNPDKIYLENVRHLLGVSTPRARRICETAVRQGVFRKMVEVICPDGVVAAAAENESELPDTVRCWIEDHGHLEEVELSTRNLPKNTFYRLNA